MGSDEIGPILTRINALLHEDLPTGCFVTFVVGLLDAEKHRLQLMSAGQGPILVYHASMTSSASCRISQTAARRTSTGRWTVYGSQFGEWVHQVRGRSVGWTRTRGSEPNQSRCHVEER